MISWDIAINIVGTMIIVAFMALVITAFVMKGSSNDNHPPLEKGWKIYDTYVTVGIIGFVGSIAGLSLINHLLDKRLKSREKDI